MTANILVLVSSLALVAGICFAAGPKPGDPMPADVRERVDRAVDDLRKAMNDEDVEGVDRAAVRLREAFGPYAGVPEREPRFLFDPSKGSRVTQDQLVVIWDRAWTADEASYRGKGKWGSAETYTDDPPALLRRSAYVVMGCLAALEHGYGDAEAIRARLDEGLAYLLSIQRRNGLFPFPDVRKTSKHFGPPLQALYDIHPEAFVDGWVIEDYGDGGLQFDNGVCAVTMLMAYEQLGDAKYLAAAKRACDWAVTRPVVPNWNYNAFSVWALARYTRVTGEPRYLDAAVRKMRLGVLPGLMENGRYFDPHNNRTVYHAINLRAMVELYDVLPADAEIRPRLLEALIRADCALVGEICSRGPTDADHSLSALRSAKRSLGKSPDRTRAINVIISAMAAQLVEDRKGVGDLTMYAVAEALKSGETGRPAHLRRHKLRDLVLEPRVDDPTQFDSSRVECPMVIRWRGQWVMYYTGIKLTDGKVDSTIGMAVSDDLIHWRDRRQVLQRGPAGAFDHGGISGPFVWAEGDELKLVYIGFPRLGYESRPGRHGLATSRDGIHWEKDSDNPVHDVGPEGSWNDAVVYKTFVMKRDGKYWMYYNAYGTPYKCEQIGLATSADLKNWTEHPDNPLVRRGDPERDRDHVIIGDPWIMRRDGRWEMYYFAFDGKHAREHLATSDDLIHWRKSEWNPIMDVGPERTYDDVHCHKPCIVLHDGVYYHFVTSVGTKEERKHHRAIGLATSRKLPEVSYRE